MTPKRWCWDACTWIATIKNEVITDANGSVIEDRGAIGAAVIADAKRGRIEIVTPGLALAEVCKRNGVANEGRDVLADFFRQPFILVIPVDREVGTRARELLLHGYPGLRPPDAIYVAAAITASASEFQSYDQKLLNLDGEVPRLDGGRLRICKPPIPTPTLFSPLGTANIADRASTAIGNLAPPSKPPRE